MMVYSVFDWDAMIDANMYDEYEINTIRTNYENGLINVYDVLEICEKLNINIY
jgi:hypothetical protein